MAYKGTPPKTMKALKILVLFAVLASSAFAQKPGFFVAAGGGVVRMEAGDFTVFNPQASIPGSPQGELLAPTNTRDTVTFVRMTVGYNFTENWALQISYADYGSAEVQMAFPQYPNYTWPSGVVANTYTRHILKYKPTALTLLPTYTMAIGDTARIIYGAGLCRSKTSSHFEATWMEGASAMTASPIYVSQTYAEESESNLGVIVSLGFDFLITKHLSWQFGGNYTAFKVMVPSSPWSGRSEANIRVDSYAGEVTLAWHW
jgi:outer membrane protein W